MNRRCPACNHTKPIEEFNSQRKYCLVCHRENGKRWREQNREKQREAQKKSRIKARQEGAIKRLPMPPKKWKPRVVGNHYRARAREFLLSVKMASSCARCDESDYRCLQFHHVRDKRADVSKMAAQGWKLETIVAELEKCIVLCANCHSKEHFGEKKHN